MLSYSIPLSMIAVTAIVINLVVANIISKKRINITRAQMRDAGKLSGVTVTGIEMIETIMDDLEEGGWQGLKNKKERLKAWDYYCYNIACKNNDKKTIVAIERKFHTGFFDALFLPSEYMHKKYPMLDKHRFLYPICWTHRLFTKGMHRLFNGSWRDTRGI